VVRDVVERDPKPAPGEQFRRGIEDSLSVDLGVTAQRPIGVGGVHANNLSEVD
jgi:hypothetical protein